MSSRPKRSPLGQAIETPQVCDPLWTAAKDLMRGNADGAKELFNETVAEALEVEAKGEWTPASDLSAYQLCSKILVRLAGTMRRRTSRQAARSVDAAAVDLPSAAPTVEVVLGELQERKQFVRKVVVELEQLGPGGRVPIKMLDCADKEVEGHEALADCVGVSPEEIHLAQRRLTKAAQRVLKQLTAARPRTLSLVLVSVVLAAPAAGCRLALSAREALDDAQEPVDGRLVLARRAERVSCPRARRLRPSPGRPLVATSGSRRTFSFGGAPVSRMPSQGPAARTCAFD